MNATKQQTETTCDPFPMPDGGLAVTVGTRRGRKVEVCNYHVNRLPGPDVALKLTKFVFESGTDSEEREYNVNVTHQTCDCKGFARHEHCKHLVCANQLLEWEGGAT